VKVSNIETKIIKDVDEDGEITFAIKALVENEFTDEDENVYVTVQGLDGEGFVVHEIDLSGKIPFGTSKVLTAKEDYFENEIYSKIVSWQEI
jgi:hypothetical protein